MGLETEWPAEAKALSDSLLRTSALAALHEGLEITRDERIRRAMEYSGLS